jgi:hypothetical protein
MNEILLLVLFVAFVMAFVLPAVAIDRWRMKRAALWHAQGSLAQAVEIYQMMKTDPKYRQEALTVWRSMKRYVRY